MGGNATKAVLYASWMRGQMHRCGLSNRGLGKQTDPADPERGRRRVQRHLSGKHFPSAPSRASYVEAFGLDGDPFTDDEDDSEQALYRDLRDARALLARVERKVRS